MPNCSSCNVPMIWAKSPAGKPFPLDARPYDLLVRDGVIEANVNKTTRYRIELEGPEYQAYKDGQGAYVSHFATCANAALHSKGRR